MNKIITRFLLFRNDKDEKTNLHINLLLFFACNSENAGDCFQTTGTYYSARNYGC